MKDKYSLYLFLWVLCLSFYPANAQDKPSTGLVQAFDSLKVQIKQAENLVSVYGNVIEIQALNQKVSEEYPSALTKVRTAQWKTADERFFAENLLLPVFAGRKDLLNAMNKMAKNRQINSLAIRNKLTYEILKYDIALLVNELAPKYAATAGKSATDEATGKTEQTTPKMTENEAKEAKDAALNLASGSLEAFMNKYNDGNPKLSVDQWKSLWNQLKASRNSKEVVTKGHKALKDHPKILETEKYGSNMRNALEALANLDK